MKIRITYSILIITIVSLLFAGCGKSWHRIEGNGNVIEETRIMPPFDRITNEGTFEVYIIQDTVHEILIEAESNLIQSIRTVIKGTTLEISTRDNLQNHYPMKLYIKVKDLYGIGLSGSGIMVTQDTIVSPEMSMSISGSGDIDALVEADWVGLTVSGSGSISSSVISDQLETSISGSGEMDLWGEVDKGNFSISGSGTIRSYELIQNICYADISGSGDMFIQVMDHLDVDISGSGTVFYMGNPSLVTKITGSGSVIKP